MPGGGQAALARSPTLEQQRLFKLLEPVGGKTLLDVGWRGIAALGAVSATLWRAVAFRLPAEIRRLINRTGLTVLERGAAYYPPCGAAARLLASMDPWLGRRTTLGAAFIPMSATKSVSVREIVIRL